MRTVLIILAVFSTAVNCSLFRSIPLSKSPMELGDIKARKEYFDVILKGNQTMAQKLENRKKWAKKHNVEKQLQEIYSYHKKDEEERYKKIKSLISDLPAALENITKVWRNQDQTYRQRLIAIDKLTNEDPMLYNALAYIWNRFTPSFRFLRTRLLNRPSRIRSRTCTGSKFRCVMRPRQVRHRTSTTEKSKTR